MTLLQNQSYKTKTSPTMQASEEFVATKTCKSTTYLCHKPERKHSDFSVFEHPCSTLYNCEQIRRR